MIIYYSFIYYKLNTINKFIKGDSMRNFKKSAFTLSEVLITLGIIGVIAAITLPTLIQKQQKKQTAVKLQKFYNIMNSALTRYYADEGIMPENFSFNDETIHNARKYKEWFENTIGKYIVYTKITTTGSVDITVLLSDGSGFSSYVANANIAHFMYCTQYKYCSVDSFDGKHTFLFNIDKGKFRPLGASHISRNTFKQYCQNPSMYGGSNTKRHYCSALIEMDGWEIKDDYPAW